MEGAVEFLSVECDMIFEPECDLQTEYQVERVEHEWNGTALPSYQNMPTPQSPLLINELFKGRNVGVYCRSDPNDPFVLVYDPTLHSVGKVKGGTEDREEGEGARRSVSHRCSVCHKQFRTRGCLVTHGLTHVHPSPGPPPPCPVCGAELPSRAALKIHVRRHFSAQNYQCPGCNQQHLTRTQLLTHQQLHATQKHNHSSTPDPAHDPTPSKTQEVVRSLPEPQKPHTNALPTKNTSHTPQPDLRCERCDVTLETRAALWAHRKSHRDRRRRHRRKHECPECGSQFWRSSALKKHRKAEHDV